VPSPNDYASVRIVVENYIKGSYTADIGLLKRCFHPDALMSGYYRGDLEIGSPQPFFDQPVETLLSPRCTYVWLLPWRLGNRLTATIF